MLVLTKTGQRNFSCVVVGGHSSFCVAKKERMKFKALKTMLIIQAAPSVSANVIKIKTFLCFCPRSHDCRQYYRAAVKSLSESTVAER